MCGICGIASAHAPLDVDLDALEEFLAFNCVPSPRSIFVDIRKLPPGHTLTWSDGATRVEQFAQTRDGVVDRARARLDVHVVASACTRRLRSTD